MFATLTNAYAIVAIGASENFYRSVVFLAFLRSTGIEMALHMAKGGGQRG